MSKPTIVILAAGMGSRYGGLKQVDGVGPCNETIMDYSLFDAQRAGFGKVIFVIRKEIEADFRKAFTNKLEGKVDFDFAYQELDVLPPGYALPPDRVKPWGTGHAVMITSSLVKGPFAVINADDFYGQHAYTLMADFLSGSAPDTLRPMYAMAGYYLNNTLSDYGYVSRGICQTNESGLLMEIAERTRIRQDHHQIVYQDEKGNLLPLPAGSVVSMNFWGFTADFFNHLNQLFPDFLEKHPGDLKSEFYLSTAVNDLISSGKASVKVLPTTATWFGVTYKEDKPLVMEKIRSLIGAGVYPEKLW